MISRIIHPSRLPRVRFTSQLILKSSLIPTITNHLLSFGVSNTKTKTKTKTFIRYNTTSTSTSASASNPIDKELLLQFTCNICNNRSSHNISKQAYDHGTVVVQCPSCKSRHLIADNLGFMEYNKKFNLEEYLKHHYGQSIETDPKNTVVEFKDIPKELKQKLKDVDNTVEDSQSTEELDLPEPKSTK